MKKVVLVNFIGREGKFGLFITLVPKVLLKHFLIGWLINFECLNVIYNHKLLSTEGVISTIIIGDLHQFISHCPVPLDQLVLDVGNLPKPQTNSLF